MLVTHDLQTIPKFAYGRVAAGQPMIVIPKDMPIGQAIEELHTVIKCLDRSECINQVIHLHVMSSTI